MLEVLLYALPLGIALSFAAGPVFFVIIETSISEGKTKALMLDLGAALADVFFILLAFYGSQSLLNSLQDNVWVGIGSGIAVAVFGAFYVRKSRTPGQFQKRVKMKRKRLFFIKGFLLNFLNIGVLFYWIAATVAIGTVVKYDPSKMLVFYVSVIVMYLLVDVFKIYFANRFKEKLRGRKIQMVEKVIGFVLVGFGLFIAVRNLV